MTQGLVTIIVPVYNAEPFLRSCIDSVRTQTYRKWELLLIDDGSADGSVEICRQYALQAESHDERICIYSCDHQGPSHARNAGLEKAEGEYVMFLDADDLLEPYAIEHCLSLMGEEHGVVCARCMTMREDGTLLEAKAVCEEKTVLQSREYLRKLLHYETIGAVWAKLYRRTVIGELRFDEELAHGEDVMWLTLLMLQTKSSVVMTTKPIYRYRIMNHSLSQSEGKIRRIQLLQRKLRALWKREKDLRPSIAYALYFNWVEILRCLPHSIKRSLKR